MVHGLSEKELLQLRAFSKQFDRVRKSPVGSGVKVKHEIFTQFTKDGIKTNVSGYDPVAFQATLPLFRQFMLNDEPVFFYGICNIIYKNCDREEIKSCVRVARKLWKENLKDVPHKMYQVLHKATDSVEDAVEKLFYGYGGLFHVDIHAIDEDGAVKDIELSLIQRAFPKLCECLNLVDSAIYWWLDAPDEAVPDFEKQLAKSVNSESQDESE